MKKKRRLRASYTIEAALLIPLFLMMMAVAMETGIRLYEETACVKEQEGLADIWAVEDFYRFSLMKEVTGESGERKR